MEELYDMIVERMNEAVINKVFTLPSINDYKVEKSDYKSGGTTMFGTQYKIGEGGRYIIVTEECKDQCRTFQVNPDRNIVTVTLYKDEKQVKSHRDFWDD